MKALSIRQPWAFAILHGRKDIENRDWRHSFRGLALIHTGQTMDRNDVEGFRETIEDNPDLGGDWLNGQTLRDLRRGGIVGAVEIVDCVSESRSPWFFGPFGFVLANARPLPFMPCRGALGFFDVPAEIAAAARQVLA